MEALWIWLATLVAPVLVSSPAVLATGSALVAHQRWIGPELVRTAAWHRNRGWICEPRDPHRYAWCETQVCTVPEMLVGAEAHLGAYLDWGSGQAVPAGRARLIVQAGLVGARVGERFFLARGDGPFVEQVGGEGPLDAVAIAEDGVYGVRGDRIGFAPKGGDTFWYRLPAQWPSGAHFEAGEGWLLRVGPTALDPARSTPPPKVHVSWDRGRTWVEKLTEITDHERNCQIHSDLRGFVVASYEDSAGCGGGEEGFRAWHPSGRVVSQHTWGFMGSSDRGWLFYQGDNDYDSPFAGQPDAFGMREGQVASDSRYLLVDPDRHIRSIFRGSLNTVPQAASAAGVPPFVNNPSAEFAVAPSGRFALIQSQIFELSDPMRFVAELPSDTQLVVMTDRGAVVKIDFSLFRIGPEGTEYLGPVPETAEAVHADLHGTVHALVDEAVYTLRDGSWRRRDLPIRPLVAER